MVENGINYFLWLIYKNGPLVSLGTKTRISPVNLETLEYLDGHIQGFLDISNNFSTLNIPPLYEVLLDETFHATYDSNNLTEIHPQEIPSNRSCFLKLMEKLVLNGL